MTTSKNYVCRQIMPNEVDLFQKAWNKRKPLFKGAPSVQNTNQLKLTTDILAKKLMTDKIVLGLFEQGSLIASLGIYPWARSPYYTMHDFFITDDGLIGFYEAANILFSKAFNIMEAKGYFTFYVVTYFRPFQIAEFMKTGSLKKIIKNIPAFSRYHMFVEDFLFEGQKSKYDTFNDLLKNNIWECPVLIRKGVLKNEYSADFFKNKILNPT